MITDCLLIIDQQAISDGEKEERTDRIMISEYSMSLLIECSVAWLTIECKRSV